MRPGEAVSLQRMKAWWAYRRRCTATARVRTAFALTISGGSVLCGAMAKHGTLRSLTIIEERRHEHQA